MQKSTAPAQPLEMNNNNSVTFEEKTTPQRLITKQDGTKIPFEKDQLKKHLQSFLKGLNEKYINLDIVVEKVASGIYNGKSNHSIITLAHPQQDQGHYVG